jgi:hypothetical protein
MKNEPEGNHFGVLIDVHGDLRVIMSPTKLKMQPTIQGDFESCAEILTTSHWLHVEPGENI